MKIYKISMITSVIMSIILLGTSLVLNFYIGTQYAIYWSNVFLGIFASAILVFATTTIGYICEEKRVIYNYYWNLVNLKSKSLLLSTLPTSSSIEKYKEAVSKINELLMEYFALFDQDFFLPRRKKIQKILDIQDALCEYKNVSIGAETCYLKLICDKCNEDGQKVYTAEHFNSDMQPFFDATNYFHGTEKPFVCYLQDKLKELEPYLSGNKG